MIEKRNKENSSPTSYFSAFGWLVFNIVFAILFLLVSGLVSGQWIEFPYYGLFSF